MRCGGFVGSLLIRGTGKASEIRAGTYTLTRGMDLDQIMVVLTSPPPKVPTVNVLIPPGYRLTQIAARVQQALGIPQKAFLDAANSGDYALEPYLPKGTSTVEGFLFPETYRFAKQGTTADEVITRLLDQFRSEAQGLPWENAKSLGVTPYQIVVIASMIEEEAKIDADRPKIAAVIYNRLAKGMTLGIDATVGYIDPDPSNGLTDADLAIDSPYNTRLNPGLPPTPIASPWTASLRAALEPAARAVPLLRGLRVGRGPSLQHRLRRVPARQGRLPWLRTSVRGSTGAHTPWASSGGPSTIASRPPCTTRPSPPQGSTGSTYRCRWRPGRCLKR